MASNLEDFVAGLYRSGVARPHELRGCTPEEVAVLERDLGFDLPETYRQFLARMGHSAGKLFAHDHVNVYYPAVLSMLRDIRTPRDELVDSPDEETYLREVTLPDNALIILGRLDEQFNFIACNGGDDAPIFYFSAEGEPPEQIYASVLDWLDDWRREAEEAIKSGYYEKWP